MHFTRGQHQQFGGFFMLRAALAFFVLGIIAILLGATGVAGLSIEIGKMLLGVFLILAVISFLAGVFTGKKTNLP
jgi:uncharacterized membrane protein YtjA (UPF0391 family)